MTTKDIGTQGEALVAQYLRKKGYTILANQWRCRFGELDLVAKDKQGVICIVEVKLRSNVSKGLPRDFVTKSKQEKLRTTAMAYLAQQDWMEESIRFDVAEVYVGGLFGTKIEYLENAF